MKRIVLAAVALALFASCKPKKCPTCDACPPPPPPCPSGECSLDLDKGTVPSVTYRLVEQDGKFFMTATLPDKRVLALPIAATQSVYVDGKLTEGGTQMLGPGSCPCRLPQCLPYCRPIASVISGTLDPNAGGGGGSGSGSGTAPTPQ
jgi:hypothetical protein